MGRATGPVGELGKNKIEIHGRGTPVAGTRGLNNQRIIPGCSEDVAVGSFELLSPGL